MRRGETRYAPVVTAETVVPQVGGDITIQF